MKRSLVGLIAIVWVLASVAAAQDVSGMVEKGVYEQETAGNVDGAIAVYKEILEKHGSDEKAAAEAQYRLGTCYLMKGDKDEAKGAFTKVLSGYPRQTAQVAKSMRELAKMTSPEGAPVVVATDPVPFDNAVSPDLDRMTVTFNRQMKDRSWSWTGGGETFPKTTAPISYNAGATTCTRPVKLEPGRVYWVGINSPSHRNFQTRDRVPARWYVILFATAGADGNPTPIPDEMTERARQINALQYGAVVEAAAEAPSQEERTASEEDRRESEDISGAAWTAWRGRRLEKAEELFVKAVELDPSNSNAWNGLGWARLNQGKRNSARDAFEKAVEAAPAHPAALNGLGWIAKGEGNAEKAIEYWKRAIEAAPNATAAAAGLAETYYERGDYGEAVKYYEMVLKYEPNDEQAKAGLEKARKAAKGQEE